MVDTVAIVGVGLLGGSIALALRERKLARRIIGVSHHQSSLAAARHLGMIDECFLEIGKEIGAAELAIICTPVNRIADIANKLLTDFPHMIVSDVGSTKSDIVGTVDQNHELAPRFVGGHPLAGSEKSGPEHARSDLFQNRMVFLTPSARTDANTTAQLRTFWHGLGGRVVEMESERHDAIMAMTSHLPHLASFALASTIPEEYLQYSGTGLHTMTRLAGSDPTMWSAIALSNSAHLLDSLQSMKRQLQAFEDAIKQGDRDQLNCLFQHGRRVHHALGSGSSVAPA